MKVLTIGLGLVLCATVVLFDLGEFRPTLLLLHSVPYADKWAHFSLLGLMAFCLNLSFPAARVPLRPLPLLRGSILLAIVATCDEFSQALLSTRTFSLGDLAANYAGIIFFGRLAAYWANRRDRNLRTREQLPPLAPDFP